MKVVFLLAHHFSEYKGGAERQAWLLGQEMQRQGVEVAFISEGEIKPTDKAEHLYRIPQRSSLKKFLNGLKIQQILKSLNPDVVIIRGNLEYLIITSFLSRNTFLVWSCSSDVYSSRDRFYKYHHQWFKRALYRIFHSRLDQVDLVTVQHLDQRAEVSELTASKSVLLPNIFSDSIQSNGTKREFVTWIGRNVPNKRPELMAEIVLAAIPKAPKYLMIVGGEISHGIAPWNELVKNPDCIVKTNCDAQEVKQHLDCSLALVNTSQFEGFSNTFLESWACGTPVFTMGVDPGGVIQQNDLGKVCSSPLEILECIAKEQSKSQVERDEQSLRLMQYVQKHHNTENITRNFLASLARELDN